MEKNIRVGNKSVKVDNGMAFALYYNDQFGEDIMTTFVPLMATIMQNLGALMEVKDGEEDVIGLLGRDESIDALFSLSTFGITGFIKVFWALAKSADEEIPPPMEWAKQFNSCPVDTVVKDVLLFALEGYVSSKNWKRLKQTLQPNSN